MDHTIFADLLPRTNKKTPRERVVFEFVVRYRSGGSATMEDTKRICMGAFHSTDDRSNPDVESISVWRNGDVIAEWTPRKGRVI